jgi:lysophospholipase L1-like esterase
MKPSAVSLCLAWLGLVSGIGASTASATRREPRSERSAVVIEGDSIVEALVGRPFAYPRNLASMVKASLRKRGAPASGIGYVPAHSAVSPEFPSASAKLGPWTYRGAWHLTGLFLHPHSRYGADGFVSSTGDPAARVSARLPGKRFAVLFARSPRGARFTFSVDGRRHRISASSQRPDGGGIAWLAAPRAGTHLVALEAPAGETVRFTGVVAREAPAPHRRDLEVSQLGHAGDLADDDLALAQRQALLALRPHLTVIMFGTNDEGLEVALHDRSFRSRYARGLRVRARLARRSGGCVIVPHAPNPRPRSVQRAYWVLSRQAARHEGCLFAPVLNSAWGPGQDSQRRGLTSDGIHPTWAGYRVIAARLARLVERAG